MYLNKIDILFDTVSQLIGSLSRTKLMDLLKKNPESIALMSEPTEEMINYVLRKNPSLIEHIRDPSEEAIEIALKADPTLIQHVKNVPLHISLRLVKRDIDRILPLIPNKDQEFYDGLLKISKRYIKYIPKQFASTKIQLQQIRVDPDYLEFIPEDEQNDKICLSAVKLKGRSLRFVKKQNYEIIKTAIENDLNSFKYIDIKSLSTEELKNIKELIQYLKIKLTTKLTKTE
jgi:hypothetical protein